MYVKQQWWRVWLCGGGVRLEKEANTIQTGWSSGRMAWMAEAGPRRSKVKRRSCTGRVSITGTIRLGKKSVQSGISIGGQLFGRRQAPCCPSHISLRLDIRLARLCGCGPFQSWWSVDDVVHVASLAWSMTCTSALLSRQAGQLGDSRAAK